MFMINVSYDKCYDKCCMLFVCYVNCMLSYLYEIAASQTFFF